MPYDAGIGALEQRKGYFGNWQNEVADRLAGNKTASMGKFGTPAPKNTANTRLSLEGKRGIESLLKEHGLYIILIKFQFTSVTSLRTEGMFGVYKRDQVVPSVLEFKYLSSRSALQCAMKPAMRLGFKSKRETRYKHKDDCQIPLTYTKDSSRVKQEAAKMRDFCQMCGKGVNLGGLR